MRMLLAVRDHAEQNRIIAEAKKYGIDVDAVCGGIDAIKHFRRKNYDAAIIDAFLEDLDGLIVCRQLRKTSELPVIVLSAGNRESDRLSAFAAGADDFLLKPFFASELLVRVKTILKRCGTGMRMPILNIAGISIRIQAREVYVDGQRVCLTPREYELLLFLAQNPNIALSRETILEKVWGPDFQGVDRTVDTHIKSLRARIKPYGDRIVSVWGYGYKLCPPGDGAVD